MSLRLRNVQVDVPPEAHEAAVAWWAAALGGTPRQVDGPYTHLDGVRSTVGVHVQRLDDGPGGYHLDLEADDVTAEVDRLLGIGAAELGPAGGWEDGTRLLADPAGLPFCVTAEGQAQHLAPTDTADLRLAVVMVDARAGVADDTLAFWAAALGGEAREVPDFPEYGWVAGIEGPGGRTAIAVQTVADGDARLHVDLHCPTATGRDEAVERLTGLGAIVTAGHAHWQVLQTPGGPIACIVPDER